MACGRYLSRCRRPGPGGSSRTFRRSPPTGTASTTRRARSSASPVHMIRLRCRLLRPSSTSTVPLERYLGAFGHLVVVRADDLSYVHVHPEDQLYRGAVRFWVTVPGPGKYRAFFDFSVGGVVRT